MNSASEGLPKGRRRGAVARKKTVDAYQALFSCNATKEQADIVLVDLAVWTGFYMVTPASAPDSVLRQTTGKREAFLRIHNFLSISERENVELHDAARREAIVTIEEGTIE